MKDIIAERIQEIVHEINELLEERKRISAQIKKLNENLIAKQGAIFELKKILEFEESTSKEES